MDNTVPYAHQIQPIFSLSTSLWNTKTNITDKVNFQSNHQQVDNTDHIVIWEFRLHSHQKFIIGQMHSSSKHQNHQWINNNLKLFQILWTRTRNIMELVHQLFSHSTNDIFNWQSVTHQVLYWQHIVPLGIKLITNTHPTIINRTKSVYQSVHLGSRNYCSSKCTSILNHHLEMLFV